MSVIGRFRLIVQVGQTKPSPAIGQTLSPLGINMMTWTKEFNERTKSVITDVPCQATIVPLTDKSYKFWVRSPQVKWFVRRCARLPRMGAKGNKEIVGNITLKEVYHIAKAKCMDPPLIGKPMKQIVMSVITCAYAMGITVTRERLPQYAKRDEIPVWDLNRRQKDMRQASKAEKRKK
eukprot:GEMP01122250.1.p1 GENE.GEMP01122250.1~~GEMP01122250.1.p1  ORF type:complete len:192 (+),score=31.37 GEMP01122250.1:44-577(+)